MAESDPNSVEAPDAIILAAGQGTRMGGDVPKVLHEVAGRPMLSWVVQACCAAGVRRCIIVVGYRADLVRRAMAAERSCQFVVQEEQLGTGHAAAMAAPLFADVARRDLFVLAGDGPLVRADTLRRLLQTHRRVEAAATLATAVLPDPDGYGRIVRGADGAFEAIVEQKDADADQRSIREVNPSYYCFDSDLLFASLKRVKRRNRQGEHYLTDVPGLLRGDGRRVEVVPAVPVEDVLSVNTPRELAEVDRVLRSRGAPAADRMGASP